MDFFNSLNLNRENLLHNLKIIKDKSKGKKICAMVKANAYGHSLKFVVNSVKNKVDFFGVANCVEALKVRECSLKAKVLICGKCNSDRLYEILENNISLTVTSLEDVNNILRCCKKLNKSANIHIKINTGMNRLGVSKDKILIKILEKIEKNSEYLVLEGVFSHLFCAENESLSKVQYLRFVDSLNKISDFYEKNTEKFKNLLVHIENSRGLFEGVDFLNICSMVRVGISLYGLEIENEKLKPVLMLKSKIIAIQNCTKESYIGYGKKVLEKDTPVAILPIGYADGIVKNYENCKVKIGKEFYPILNICMDMILVDLKGKRYNEGDEVILISDNPKDENSINNLSKIQGSLSYELATNLKHNRLNIIIQNP